MADGFATSTLSSRHAANAISPRLFSVAELDAMFEANILSRDERIELISGEIIQMNSQMMPHGVLKFRLAVALAAQLSDGLEVQSELTVKLDDQTLVDPDIAITPRLKIERRYLRPDELIMAIEVSDTTLSFDLTTKAKLYARAGIKELWIVDINGAQTWVHKKPDDTGYTLLVSVPFIEPLIAETVDGVDVVIDRFFR
jgi:Uma2 family endonuclease